MHHAQLSNKSRKTTTSINQTSPSSTSLTIRCLCSSVIVGRRSQKHLVKRSNVKTPAITKQATMRSVSVLSSLASPETFSVRSAGVPLSWSFAWSAAGRRLASGYEAKGSRTDQTKKSEKFQSNYASIFTYLLIFSTMSITVDVICDILEFGEVASVRSGVEPQVARVQGHAAGP